MIFPIIIYDPATIHIYKSINSFFSGIEPENIKCNIYEAFDASGQKLSLSVVVVKNKNKILRIFAPKVEVVDIYETGVYEKERLHDILKMTILDHPHIFKYNKDPMESNLDELVDYFTGVP